MVERKERGVAVRLERWLPNRVRSWWNRQRNPRRLNHLLKKASNPLTMLNQILKFLMVGLFDHFIPLVKANSDFNPNSVDVYIKRKRFLLCFTGSKAKDNTQFDPNRPQDYRKKVHLWFALYVQNIFTKICIILMLNYLNVLSCRNSLKDKKITFLQETEVCRTWEANRKGKHSEQ